MLIIKLTIDKKKVLSKCGPIQIKHVSLWGLSLVQTHPRCLGTKSNQIMHAHLKLRGRGDILACTRPILAKATCLVLGIGPQHW